MYKIYVLIITLVFSFLAIGSSSAQDVSSFTHFTTDNGLPTNNIYCGLADDLGNIWFGTEDGVVKYNGYSFRTFTTEDGLPSNDVWKIWKDSVGRIWLYSIATTFGYIKDDKYYPIDLDVKGNIYRVSFEGVVGDNTYFIAGGVMQVFFIVDKYGKVTYRYNNEGNIFVGMSQDIKVYKRNEIEHHVLEEYEYKDRLSLVKTYIDTVTNNPRYTTSTDMFGRYLFSFTYLDKSIVLDFYNIVSGKIKSIPIQELGGGADEKIYVRLRGPVNATIITNKAAYVFLDDSFSTVKRIDVKKVVPTNAQLSYFMNDKSGNSWYMTNGDGVWMKSMPLNIFKNENIIRGIENATYVGYGHNKKSYWFDKENESLIILNSDGTVFRKIHTTKVILNVKAYIDGNVLISTKSTFDIYNEKTNEIKPFLNCFSYRYDSRRNEHYTYKDSLFQYDLSGLNNWVYESKKNIWLISNNELAKINISNDSLFYKSHILGKYYDIVKDTFNRKVWITNQSAVSLFDMDSGVKKSYNRQLLTLLGVNTINKMLIDKHANYYILTEKNLIVYNGKTGEIKYKKLNVDLNHAVMEIYNDMLFIGGRFGLAYSSILSSGHLSEFKIAPNIKGDNYTRLRSIFFNESGEGIIGTDKGNYRIHINDLRNGSDVLKVGNMSFVNVIARVPNEVVLRNNDTFSLKQTIPSISLDMNNIYGSGKTTVRYRVEGYSDWQDIKSGDIILAGLKVGKYYTVYCSIKDDLWSSEIHKFTIYRVPKWWQTNSWKTAFWGSGIISFVLLIVMVVLITRYIVAKKNEKRQQLTELEIRAIYSQINPHFIFNTLSTALFFIDKKDFDQAYTHVSKFSRLLRSYLKSSQERYVSVAEEIRMLENYIELQQIRFDNRFIYDIDVENKIATESILIPSLLLQPIVENAINHGLFHMQGVGELIIRFRQGERTDELICEIEDNGVGRAKSDEIRKSDSTKKESYGTKLTQSLIEIFKEYEKMNINMEYIDKETPDSGTIVKLTIKKIKYVT